MYLKRINVKNYSAFKETGWIDFEPGINLIVGQNNSGKSALLRVFEAGLSDDRHRNADEYRYERLEAPQLYAEVVISGQEILGSMLMHQDQYYWPIQDIAEKGLDKVNNYLSQPQHNFHLNRIAGQSFSSNRVPVHGQFDGPAKLSLVLKAKNGQLETVSQTSDINDSLTVIIDDVWKRNIFSFKAQRYSVGKCGYGRQEILNSDARNLAAVLAKLQGEQGSIFRKLVSHLREIFATVQNLSVTSLQTEFEIRVWATEEQVHPELGFPLDNCGTGVAQVVAILTVAMTFERAVIVIDEISSFLHPAAAKALLRIIQTNYAQHQYIISTHSPEVLSAANPSTVHLVKRNGYDSVVERVELSKLDELRDVASHLGVSMTDVFAAERIIWVEGPTEELCFPYIYKEQVGNLPRGVVVTPVIATGDFNGKRSRPELVFEVYQRLSEVASPLVRQVTFSFDQETLSKEEMDKLKEKSRRHLLFLPRRHFECYLLDPSAIAAFILSRVPDLQDNITENAVLDCLLRIGGDQKFKASDKWNGDIFNEEWLTKVDAAVLIKEACNELTKARLSFSKNRHSFEILKHIMEQRPNSVQALFDFVKELFEMAQRD